MPSNAVRTCIAILCGTLVVAAGVAAAGEVLTGRALDGRYRLYKGPTLPQEQVAILTTQPDTPLKLVGIDNVPGPHKEQGYGHFYHWSINLEIPPGPHALAFIYQRVYNSASGGISWSQTASHSQMVLFVAKPGQLYQVKAVLEAGASWYSAKVVEVGAIPEKYERPVKSCEQFPAGGSRCLEPAAITKK